MLTMSHLQKDETERAVVMKASLVANEDCAVQSLRRCAGPIHAHIPL